MTGMVDTVRTRILTFALQIQEQMASDEEETVKQIPAAMVEHIVQVTIYGGQNVIGDGNTFNAPVVVAGDLASLKTAISALGVPEDEFKNLEASLDNDRALATDGAQKLGDSTLHWIAKTAKKVGASGLKIGTAVAEEAIKRAVFGYLGF